MAASLQCLAEYTFSFVSFVRGFHVYQCIWDPEIGEQLNCTIEKNNPHDRFAAAVTKEDEIVGHIPKEYSHICSFFLRCEAKISCVVTGARRNRGLA